MCDGSLVPCAGHPVLEGRGRTSALLCAPARVLLGGTQTWGIVSNWLVLKVTVVISTRTEATMVVAPANEHSPSCLITTTFNTQETCMGSDDAYRTNLHLLYVSPPSKKCKPEHCSTMNLAGIIVSSMTSHFKGWFLFIGKAPKLIPSCKLSS